MDFITIDRGLATLIAAIIAALMSILTTLYFNKREEIRAARRKTLEEFIFVIADSVHQLVACSKILRENKTEISRKNWEERAEKAKTKLNKLRPKIRYALWGIDKSMKPLLILPETILYTLESEQVCEKVFISGKELGDALDNCIRKCFFYGRLPSLYERWKLNKLAKNCRKIRNDYQLKKGEINVSYRDILP